jgi:hypothetical protein
MTPEQKLAAIIEAQAKGGYPYWEATDIREELQEGEPYQAYEYILLTILLDPQGLKAAYEDKQCDPEGDIGEGPSYWNARFGIDRRIWQHKAHKILDSWLSGEAEAAITTAYDLLP